MAERFARSEVGRGRIGDEFHAAQATGDQGGVAKITAANDTVDVFACQVCGAVAGIYFDLDVEVVGVEGCQCRYHRCVAMVVPMWRLRSQRLVGPDAAYITGATLNVDGGQNS